MKQNMPNILAENLTKKFGTLTAVDGLNFYVNKGEIFGLVGPDGAGKSTTMRMLSSIMEPTSGSAYISGNDVVSDSSSAKDCLAYMSQKFGLYQDLTVIENIEFYANLYGVPAKGRNSHINELLDFSQMRPFRKWRSGNLSGGMKQKLQLICALVHTPGVLLLDEPTNGVDPVSRRDFWRILYSLLKKKISIFVATSYLDEAERCDRVALIDNGKILAIETPREIKKLMHGKILTIISFQAKKIKRLFQNDPGILSVNVFGDTVHIVCNNPDAMKEKSRKLISGAGLEYVEIRESMPSLEDVFISVLNRETKKENEFSLQSPPEPDIPIYYEVSKSETVVSVSHLTRRFGSFTAVNNISFQIRPGEIFGFLGPNGAGKSTTIRMLCGLLESSSGNGKVAGFDIITQKEEIKQHIGYMSQKFSLYEDLTVDENIDFYGGIYGLRGKKLLQRKAWALEMAGLEKHRKNLTAFLSGGWKQRLALACAILHAPPVIFLDEPTSGVDPIRRRRFWDLIYKMADKGITIFVTTHYMEESEYCDRVALIYGGNIIATGSPLELKTSLMKEDILELRCEKPHEIIEFLEVLPEVRDIGLFGAGLHISTGDFESAEKAISLKLRELEVKIDTIEKIIPTMEDVFVSLIDQFNSNEKETSDKEGKIR